MPSAVRSRRSPKPLAALTLAGAVIWPALAHGQVGELKPARLEYEYFPSSSVSGAGAPLSEARFQSTRVTATLPVMVGKHTILLPGLRYQLLDIGGDASSASSVAEPIEALHAMQLSFGVFRRISESWSVFGQLGGGLAGDLSNDVASDDWVVNAQLLGMWTLERSFTLGAGFGYDRRTGEVAPLPLLAVNWEPSSDWLVRGVLPQFLAVRYRPDERATLALDSGLEGERFHLSEDRVGVARSEVAYSAIKVGPSLTLHWTDWLHTRINGGVALHRRFDLYRDDREQGDLEVGTGPYAGLELWLGPSGWSSDAAEAALAAAGSPRDEAEREHD